MPPDQWARKARAYSEVVVAKVKRTIEKRTTTDGASKEKECNESKHSFPSAHPSGTFWTGSEKRSA